MIPDADRVKPYRARFGKVRRTPACGPFDGGAITSNGGVVLLAAADRAIGLSRRLAQCFPDLRFADAVRPSVPDLLRQRIFGLALGHEDLIDHDALRDDPALAAVLGWGLRVLSPDAPFTEAKPFSRTVQKIMIVLTDGAMVTDGGYSQCAGRTHTSEPYRFDPASVGLQGRVLTGGPANDSFTPYGYLYDSKPFNSPMTSHEDADKELDRLSVEACSEFKTTAGSLGRAELYTIAFSNGAGPGTRAHDVLATCASSKAHFFFAEDGTRMSQVFEEIAKRSIKLRLTQ